MGRRAPSVQFYYNAAYISPITDGSKVIGVEIENIGQFSVKLLSIVQV